MITRGDSVTSCKWCGVPAVTDSGDDCPVLWWLRCCREGVNP